MADLIVGDTGNDVILGDNGTISGAARDVVTNPDGGAGDDSLYGGGNDDVIFGEGGADWITGDVPGATGLDILVGDQGTHCDLITAQHSTASGSGGADRCSQRRRRSCSAAMQPTRFPATPVTTSSSATTAR